MKKLNSSFWIWLVFIVVVGGIVYLATLGNKDIISTQPKSKKESLKSRHNRLQKLIVSKKELKLILQKVFNRIYFIIRLLISSLFAAYNFAGWYLMEYRAVGDFVNWIAIGGIILSVFAFITHGSYKGYLIYIDNMKMWIEVKVYGKYVNVDEDLDKHEDDKKKLMEEISTEENKTKALLI